MLLRGFGFGKSPLQGGSFSKRGGTFLASLWFPADFESDLGKATVNLQQRELGAGWGLGFTHPISNRGA